jgi:hypothetical protein
MGSGAVVRLLQRIIFPPCSMSLSEPPSHRLFSFHLDGKFGTLRLDWIPGLSPEKNAVELYQRFHALMEHRFPGCFQEGRISHLGYVDGFSGRVNGLIEEADVFY